MLPEEVPGVSRLPVNANVVEGRNYDILYELFFFILYSCLLSLSAALGPLARAR
jgi:hypothetical protein